jgi:hypothetical protein
MRTVANAFSGERQIAYQQADIEKLKEEGVLAKAEDLWLEEFRRQGAEDRGTCCGGKGIEICYIGPRKSHYEYANIVRCPTGQGNLSAAESVGPAIEYLKSKGIECKYNDGWMD